MPSEAYAIQLQQQLSEFYGIEWFADKYRYRALDMAARTDFIPHAWARPGVYRIRVVNPESEWFGSEYIGQSMNVRQRLMGHFVIHGETWSCSPGKILKSHLEARVLSLFQVGISRRDLLDCEHYWVSLLKPQLNKAKTSFGPASSHTPTQACLASKQALSAQGS